MTGEADGGGKRDWMAGLVLIAALVGGLVLSGCGEAKPDAGAVNMDMYHKALERTAPGRMPLVTKGTDMEREAIRKFTDFYREYSSDIIRKHCRAVYAEDAYFGDPFKSVEGIDPIEAYFIKMAEPVKECTFAIEGVHSEQSEYYIRWVMKLTIKRSPNDPIVAQGISHVRFGADGKVVFQQDYWDTSVMFERIPVVGGLTRWVKRRLDS